MEKVIIFPPVQNKSTSAAAEKTFKLKIFISRETTDPSNRISCKMEQMERILLIVIRNGYYEML